MICPSCGRESNNEDVSVCPFCGDQMGTVRLVYESKKGSCDNEKTIENTTSDSDVLIACDSGS